MGWTWFLSLSLLLGLLESGLASECCKNKIVGGVAYSLFREEDTSTFGCLNNCVYRNHDAPGEKFCFKQGNLEVQCRNSMRIRKNLTDLKPNTPEFNKLVRALSAAKKSGSYHGPPIYGSQNNNSKDFNSSYNAATSFHGYPGLCGSGGCCIHGYSTFLPWHRLFVVQLEDALRSSPGYHDVTLPYWDWTQNFKKLPLLIRNLTISDGQEDIENPFYHSLLPGPPVLDPKNNPPPFNGSFYGFTKRSPQALVGFTHHHCIDKNKTADCPFPNKEDFPSETVLGDMVLTALEATDYEHFESQIEMPHNQFHNQLGFINLPTTPNCGNGHNGYCYPYTMQDIFFASFDPIFLVFHTMVDYQWAIFEALQRYRNISYEDDCHPSFGQVLQPYATAFNSNPATKSHSRGNETVNYNNAFGYEYDNLTLFGKTIPGLNAFLFDRNKKDRLFAGFSLPNMPIKNITFNICYPSTNCSFSNKNFHISKVNGNPMEKSGLYIDSILKYFEVTKYLPLGLSADQDISFKIVRTTIPDDVTFTPVSIFRKAREDKERITVQWRGDSEKYRYAPSFKIRQGSTASMRFLLEDGTSLVDQYSNLEDFKLCTNANVTDQEIKIEANQKYFFKNPLVAGCTNKLKVDTSNPCKFDPLVRDSEGNATIKWQIDMHQYTKGICMKPGSRLTFFWEDSYHNVTNLTGETKEKDFDKCENIPQYEPQGYSGPKSITFPPKDEDGFKEKVGVYYIVCPVGDHCYYGMKIKITVQEICP